MTRSVLCSLVLLSACSEFNISSKNEAEEVPAPDIEVDPPELSFGAWPSGAEAVETFTISNVGDGPLELDRVVIDVGEAFSILTDVSGVILGPGESTPVDVSFTPLEANRNEGRALVLSDDPADPELPVDLVGRGAVPELLIDPPSYDFGTGVIPCDTVLDLALTNVGVEDLEIYGVGFEGDQMVLNEALDLPVVLAPEESVPVQVVYSPAVIGAAWGELTVDSNDPRGLVVGDQRGETTYGSTNVDGFEIPENPPVDILFAVDQSCSMADDQRRLATAFGDFIAEIDAVTGGWQIGVVTLDHGCFNGGILRNSTPDYYGKFEIAVSESGGLFDTALTESLLQLSAKAAGKAGGGECNESFLRPDALLHVIVVSDEREQSGDPEGYVAQMQGIKGDPNLLKVSAVVDIDASCGDQGADNGSAGYAGAVAATGGLMLDICNDAWGARADELAVASLSGIGRYALSGDPEVDTIEVFIDGEPILSGWSYDASDNSIVLDAELDGGEFIEVSYEAFADCR
ncbi:MAG: hypothetical protein ACI8PZ_001951 [Myxococcota bacterium]|jgi:hypothetical protein